MGKPAARVSDMHVCPMVTPGTPPVPHVGGPILPPGAPTVLIGGMPAATLGNMCTCVGPPDTIITGSTGVLIGGMPAARMGDSTAHGGTIAVGCPTVLIGEIDVGSAASALALLPPVFIAETLAKLPATDSKAIAEGIALKLAAQTGEITANALAIKKVLPHTDDGLTPEQRREKATAFYENEWGWNREKDRQKIEAHLKGIDLNQPIHIVEIPPNGDGADGNMIHAYSGDTPGNYCTPDPDATPSDLGINPDTADPTSGKMIPKKKNTVTIPEGERLIVLRSSAAKITDTWSVVGKPYNCKGGGIQMVFNNQKKKIF